MLAFELGAGNSLYGHCPLLAFNQEMASMISKSYLNVDFYILRQPILCDVMPIEIGGVS